MMAIPTLRGYFDALGIAAYSDFVGVLWFGTGLFIMSGLAVAQVDAWAADDGEGRLGGDARGRRIARACGHGAHRRADGHRRRRRGRQLGGLVLRRARPRHRRSG
jgi:hypothetical protein